MEKEVLASARKYQQEHQWRKSIECLDRYMEDNEGPFSDALYAIYARSLRIIGQASSAKEMLHRGKKHYPESERIFREFHVLHDYLGEWEAAKNVAMQLIKINPKQADYHFRLGRSYSFLSNFKKAKKSYQTALEYTHSMPYIELVKQIQRSFADNPDEVRSDYVFIDGKNNLGAFIHQYKDKKFFTKISKYKNETTGPRREETFYRNLCDEFPQLKNLAPRFVDSQFIDKVSYLTIEMIDSVSVEKNPIQKVIESSRQISTVKYREIADKYPPPAYVFQFRKGRAISVIHFFTRIHEEKYNTKLFKGVNLILKQHKYPKAVRHLMQRLETAIMDNRLFDHMEPEKHYSLLHGDFAFQNLLTKKEDQAVSVIDWTSFTIGPHFVDLARYFTSLLLPYAEIKEQYLQKEDAGKTLSLVEQIFFLYALIIFYFQKMGRRGFESRLSEFILPALEDLENLVLKFKLSREGDQLKKESLLLSENVQEKELQLKQFEQRVFVLEEEKKHLNKRLQETLNSKSWKMTAPLRLFTERKKLKD